VYPDLLWECEPGSGSRRARLCFGNANPDPDPGGQKLYTKIKKCRNFMFRSVGCAFLRIGGFSCSLVNPGIHFSNFDFKKFDYFQQ
jgi:hypothetical protein